MTLDIWDDGDWIDIGDRGRSDGLDHPLDLREHRLDLPDHGDAGRGRGPPDWGVRADEVRYAVERWDWRERGRSRDNGGGQGGGRHGWGGGDHGHDVGHHDRGLPGLTLFDRGPSRRQQREQAQRDRSRSR